MRYMQRHHKPLANILLENSMCFGRSDGVYAGVVDNHKGKSTSKGERIGAINAERRSLIMKKVAFLTTAIIVLAVSVVSADPDLANWLAQAQSTPGNVTADATGWTFDGTAGVPYDYGTLGGTEASVEYVFNLTDSGVSIALGSLYGWGTERNTYKLEQWNDQGIFGITLEGYYDERFPGVSSTFDVDTHVVFVNLPTGNQELYINGVSQGLDTRGGGWWTTGGAGFLGQTSWGADVCVGTIYGVASYNRALSAVEVSSLYDSYAFGGKAGLPDPGNLESQVCTSAVLSWEPGIYADKHDVYFGTDETKVTDADRNNQLGVLVGQNQDASHYPIAGALALDFDTTYYWRIDEVNAAPGYDIHKGNVWQFTTEPFVYPIDNINATASSSDPDKGPENTLSLDGDLHSTDTAAMWLSASESPGNAWIQYEFDKIYKLYEMWVWNYNGEGLNTAFGLKEVAIEYSTNGTDFTALGATDEFLAAPGADAYAHNTTVDFAGVAAQYVRITANSNWGGGMVDQYGLSEVRFFCVPVHAGTLLTPSLAGKQGEMQRGTIYISALICRLWPRALLVPTASPLTGRASHPTACHLNWAGCTTGRLTRSIWPRSLIRGKVISGALRHRNILLWTI